MTNVIDGLLLRARNRLILRELLEKVTIAGACFFAAVVLLLLLGTQILNPWVPVALAAATFGGGLVWVYRKAPSTLQMARMLDQRCALADALSTELHFRESGLPLASIQRQKAEHDAAQVDLDFVFPFRRPKSSFAVAGLASVALCLLLLRYGVEHRLQLNAPISFIQFGPLSQTARADGPSSAKSKDSDKANGKMTPELLSRLGDSTSDSAQPRDLHSPAGNALTTGAGAADDAEKSAASEGRESKGQTSSGDSSEGDSASPKAGPDQPPSGRDGSPQSAQSGGKSGNPSDSGASMLSKLRDAVSSMMSKMKQPGDQPPQSGQQGSPQGAGKKPNGQSGGQKAGDQDAKGASSPQDGDENAAAEPEQSAPGQGADKSSDQNASAKPGSGMGSQDGSKELRDAEQLAAMGKLSEIIGKRSANVTGEMTIEPQSGPQQLKTGYTHSNARHGEAGGDVSRDEVPVALQSYVEQYFEQVRKQAAVKTARAGKAQPSQ